MEPFKWVQSKRMIILNFLSERYQQLIVSFYKVVEPSSVDSRLPLCIVKRQQIPCDLPGYDKYLTCLDLNVQKQVKILDRIYTITDCDQITRSYLSRAGVDVPESIEIPE